MASNVRRAAQDGATGAKTWATPHVHRARSWAAPRVENAGHAVRDSIAPKVSDALVSAAQRIDSKASTRRSWPKLLGLVALFAAAGSAVAAVVIRRWPFAASYDSMVKDMPAPSANSDYAVPEEAEVNGRVRSH
jgi:hypothetical protein